MSRMKLIVLLLALPLFGCDDGSLPLSEYEDVDVNVYFYFPNDSRGEIEFYNFYKKLGGKFKMDWGQNKGDNLLIAKSVLMTAECSYINFDVTK
jgi:hypothetical protein